MLINAIFLSTWAILPNKLPMTWSSNKKLIVTCISSLIIWTSAGIVAIQAVDLAIKNNYSAYHISIIGFLLTSTGFDIEFLLITIPSFLTQQFVRSE